MAENLREFWEFLPKILREYNGNTGQGIRGMLTSNEVYVRQFLPTLICPHLHAVLDAEYLDDDFCQDLTKFINGRLMAHEPDFSLHASVRLQRITTKFDLKSVLKYLVKPISLSSQYETAWTQMIEVGQKESWQLNNEVRDFIMGIGLVCRYPKRIQNIRAYGSMNGNSMDTICVVAARRNDYWDEICQIPASDRNWSSAET